jgi:hypothetical protein
MFSQSVEGNIRALEREQGVGKWSSTTRNFIIPIFPPLILRGKL